MISLVQSIFHPTDLSKGSQNAFAHALGLTLLARSKITILNASKQDGHKAEWKKFPGVREMLERWGKLEKGSARSAVFQKLGIGVEKITVKNKDPASAALQFLEDDPTDMIVLATEGRDGLQRWLRPSVAEPVARRSRTMTLFVPNSSRGFVDARTGEFKLRRVLIPVDRVPIPEPSLDVAADLAGLLGGDALDVTLTHVGAEDDRPPINLPEDPGCSWRFSHRSGDVVEEILAEVEATSPDLLVMTTQGHNGFLDALRGSTTEQVMRRAPCPLLAVPAI